MSLAAAHELTIRRALASDLADIVAIEQECFSDPWTSRSLAQLLTRDEALFNVAVRRTVTAAHGEASDAESVVGFSIAHVVADEAELANVAVRKSAQREGIGRRLLDHVAEEARKRGAVELFLEVRESNVAARAMYQRAGFFEIGRRIRYYDRPVEDALVLRLQLV